MKQTNDLIDRFRNKAGAWQSQEQAERLKKELKDVLSDEDYTKLSIAHSHYLLGEGADELYLVCKELNSKTKKIEPISLSKHYIKPKPINEKAILLSRNLIDEFIKSISFKKQKNLK